MFEYKTEVFSKLDIGLPGLDRDCSKVSLNELGEQGWELIAIFDGIFFFKRRIRKD